MTEPLRAEPRLQPALLTRGQVSAIFGIDARTLRRWELRGLIAAVRVGRTVLLR